jgi:hypothetical protein
MNKTQCRRRRSRQWRVGLAQDLRDESFAREFVLACRDEGVGVAAAFGPLRAQDRARRVPNLLVHPPKPTAALRAAARRLSARRRSGGSQSKLTKLE